MVLLKFKSGLRYIAFVKNIKLHIEETVDNFFLISLITYL